MSACYSLQQAKITLLAKFTFREALHEAWPNSVLKRVVWRLRSALATATTANDFHFFEILFQVRYVNAMGGFQQGKTSSQSGSSLNLIVKWT